jgi:hypothetical protein
LLHHKSKKKIFFFIPIHSFPFFFSLRYDFLVIPIIRKQYGTDLLTTYGSKQSTWPAFASRLKGVGESAGKTSK